MTNKNIKLDFIKKLNDTQMKKLIMLTIIKHDQEKYTHTAASFSSMNDFIYSFDELDENIEKHNDYIIVKIFSQKSCPDLIYEYLINDFSMLIIEAPYSFEFSNYDELLQMFMTSEFGNVYTESLYQKRIEDALREKNRLDSYSRDYIQSMQNSINNSNKPKNKLKRFLRI